MASIKTRIAPSPTGNLHVGTARSALFNELFARKQGGEFLVRVEDTDKERSKPEYEENIVEGLKWLGLTWDGDIVRQSENLEAHTAALQTLLDADKAYLEDKAIRLRVEPKEISFTDLVRGEVKVHTDGFEGDFVIARAIDDPLYHLAVVVDDHDMAITHVIRGEDHLHNTIKHILIQRALGYEQPEYAHLPLLLDENRKKLSKRAGETNLLAFRDMGYLPEAMVNYLALLGWNPGDDREIFSHEELIKEFSLEKVQKGGAIFSIEKLQSVNKHYIKELSSEELLKQAQPFLEKAGVEISDEEYMKQALATEQDRVATLAELPEAIGFFLPGWEADYDPGILVWRKSDADTTRELLTKLTQKIEMLEENEFIAERLEEVLMAWIDEHELGRGDTLWPMRVALTGREHSPGPFEVAAVLGRDETLKRLEIAEGKLAT